MGDESNRSSDALQGTGVEDSEPVKRGRADHRDEKLANKREKERVSSESWSDCTRGNSSRKESKASELKTLASELLCEAALADFDESSHLLTEVPVEYSLQPLQSVEKLKEQAKAVGGKSHKIVTGTSSEVHTPVPNVTSKLEVSPAFVAKSDISIPNSLLVKNENSKCLLEQDKQNSPGSNSLSNGPIRKISDGYNWRKYGQKQVKSPKGSRSYYKCTFSDCCAKKIECCDPSNHLIETVYRSHHNHDPPQKLNCMKESLPASPVGPVSGDNDSFHPVIYSNDPVKDNKLMQSIQGTNEIPGTEKHESSGSDETTEVNMEEYVDGVESMKRQKTNSAADMESPSKPVEKSKCIIHAAGDMGISGDGYRWRKYGQKMVKGNPHPRNYYKCTSAGCPVRKLIERAVDNTNAVVITYKGTHDHGLPVQRKCDGPKSSVVADSCLTSEENQAKQLHNGQTQWSVNKGCELTGGPSNVSGEKASDSARTLVDFGFEIRPC